MKETKKENTSLQLLQMSEIQEQAVQWLWFPYIPFGKITIIQGNPGDGKTTLALYLTAACSAGRLPEFLEPFPVIYQTAEDGLADTIKPRLRKSKAEMSNIYCIDESERSLTLLDHRLEEAIEKTGSRLLILDPVQGYLASGTDMNRANDIRQHMKALSAVAERTGCAVILVGHLNKAAGISSSYRGLGSIDFRAAARSVLLVGRLRDQPEIRAVVHDKSSLAQEGCSRAFKIDERDGFRWLEGYGDITADALLNGGSTDSKVALAETLIRELLSDGKSVPATEVLKAATSRGISKRTLDQAKRNLGNVVSRRNNHAWEWYIKDENIYPPDTA